MRTPVEAALEARRLELGLNWRSLATRSRISHETLRQLRIGEPVSALTDANVEKTLQWEPGSLYAVRDGGQPTPAAREVYAPDAPVPEVVADLFAAMGIDGQSPRECVAHLCEEVGELAKATRTGDRINLAEEVGDVGILLHRIAALYGVDVDQAVREKAASRLERHRNATKEAQ